MFSTVYSENLTRANSIYENNFSLFGTNSLLNENSLNYTKQRSNQVSNDIRILVVDDLVSVRESLRTILTLEDDIKVIGEANNGEQAVELARVLHPDVVIMDIEMPSGGSYDGIEACSVMKAENLAASVIVLTVHADLKSRQRALIADADLFLEKGISSRELVNQIRRLANKE